MTTKAARTKTRIMDAAEAVVLDRGFAAASVDAIQEAAGISRGTFFYHFASKDDLSRALIERYAQLDRDLADKLMERAENLASDPVQQLLLFFALHEEIFEEAEGVFPGCLFASYSYEAGLFDPETAQIVDTSVEYWTNLVAKKLQEATARQPLAIEIDPLVLADAAYAIFQGAFILTRLRNDKSVMALQIRQIRHYFELLFGVRE